MQASDKSKNDSVPEFVSDDEGETSDDQIEGSPTNLKNKVKSILGFGEEDSDNPSPKVSDSETETETEGDDSEGEGEGEEKPNLKSGFSKLLVSLKDAVGDIVGDTGSAAIEVEQANVDKQGRRKGKPVASAAAAASSKASSRKKKLRGVQPTEEELAYNSDDDEQDGDGNSDKGDSDDNDESKLKKFDKELREDYLVNFHPESLIQNYDEIYNLARVVRDANGVIVDSLHKTLPMLTKYEKTRILGQRAKQINDGATPFVKVPEGVIDGYLIAIRELEEKKIPFIIRRPLPNRGSEYWMVEDLEIVI
jgi:DNA-directed RNA polymerase I, II, and III subunit RPABC2